MIQTSAAEELRDRIAHELMSLSYDELDSLRNSLPRTGDDEWRELPQEDISGETVHVYALMYRWGLLRSRISVEIVLVSDDESVDPEVVPSWYFERFRSGKLGPARWRLARAVWNLLRYAVLGAIAILLMVLLWRFVS